jgi:predicted ATPase/DNA-binding XRE family transcriptional regulator
MNQKLPEDLSFGEWLRQRRRALDLTQQELADEVGCARITLRRIEGGALKPSKELAAILLERLGAPHDERERWLHFARGLSEFPQNLDHLFTKNPITNLPTSLKSFIGREKERDEVVQLLEKNRLVTLIGAGGIGKTRLSLQVGEKLLPAHSDGIWMVALDPLSDPKLISHSIASVFDIRESPDQDILVKLLDALREKSMLLILDNCEHLLPTCTQLVETLLKNCPNLRIMATSRETLGAAGEAIYAVPPLSTPIVQNKVVENIWTEYESVRLFHERAKLTLASFALSNDKALAITNICHRLDGIPLAIELAAARVNILHVDEILDQLNHCFDLLVGNQRTALPRHQTMRASMDWSWELLTEREQILMRELSVFAGGWTLDSANAIGDGDVLNLIGSLVMKSLIVVEQETGRETRFRFHEIIRQYAGEKLLESGTEKNTRNRHLRYFLYLSEQAETALRGPAQMEWITRLEEESDNFRTALDWAAKGDVEAGLYLSSRLHNFKVGFDLLDLDLREGAHWLLEFLQKPESSLYPRARAKALYAYGETLILTQKFIRAGICIEEGLALDRSNGNKSGEVDGLLLLALNMANTGDIEKQKELGQAALKLARTLGDKWRLAEVLGFLGRIDPDPQRSKDYLQQSIHLCREIGDLQNLTRFLGHLGRIEMLNGEFEIAPKRLEEAVFLSRQMNRTSLPFSVLDASGRMALLQGKYEQAHHYLQNGLEYADKTGERMMALWFRAHLGYVTLKQGDPVGTRAHFTKCVNEFLKDQVEIGVVFAIEGMASLHIVLGRPERAARLIGWVDRMRKKLHDLRPPLEQANVDKDTVECLNKMGEVAFSDAYDEGQAMTIEEAVEYALAEN